MHRFGCFSFSHPQARGFQVLGCGVGDDGSLLREGVPLQEVRTGWARRRCTKPLISDQDLRLKCGMGKNDDNEDRFRRLRKFLHHLTPCFFHCLFDASNVRSSCFYTCHDRVNASFPVAFPSGPMAGPLQTLFREDQMWRPNFSRSGSTHAQTLCVLLTSARLGKSTSQADAGSVDFFRLWAASDATKLQCSVDKGVFSR